MGRNYIHRDIKPDNFLVGIGNRANQVFMIDFGLAKRYRNDRTLQHIPYRDGKDLTGTARYASLNSHLGLEPSRRDDLEAIGYVLVYFSTGGLPWQKLKASRKKNKDAKILEKKLSISVNALCSGLPTEVADFLSYCRGLRFEDRPDYSYLRRQLKTYFFQEGFRYDHFFDWTFPPEQDKNDANAPPQQGR